MPIQIGFAVLTHNHPGQLLTLVRTLNVMFGEPPIACHHHFGMCPMETGAFPPNVAFVTPHLNAQWGSVSLPLAALKTFELLKERFDPDWFVLLSGSDYPVMDADTIVRDLSETTFDAFMDAREIRAGCPPDNQTAAFGFASPEFFAKAVDRYFHPRLWLPWPSRTRLASGKFPIWKRYFNMENRWMGTVASKLPPSMKIYAGDFWFHANRKAIGSLFRAPIEALAGYYDGRYIPEESFLHAALGNDPALNISTDSRRYTDWTQGGAHPKWLGLEDAPDIVKSKAYFARKFRPGTPEPGFLEAVGLRIRVLA